MCAMRYAHEEGMKLQSHQRLRVYGSLLILAIVALVSLSVFLEIDRQLDRSATAESDNRTWVLAQLEVDLLRYERSLYAAQADQSKPRLDDVRLAFDILYSRVDLVGRAPTLDSLPLRQSKGWLELSGPGGLIETTVPVIDSADSELQAGIPELIARMPPVTRDVRQAVVESLAKSMDSGDEARHDLRNSLRAFTMALIIIMVVMALLLLAIYFQGRTQSRHAKMLELAVHNLRTMIDSSQDAVLMIDADQNVTGSNRAGEVMLGLTFSRRAPVRLADMLSDDEGGELTAGTRRRMTCRRADGSKFPVEATLARARTATGQSFSIAFLRDMSEQLEHERSLAEARNAAMQGDEAKARFLAVMSHEMRTPLNGLLSATELLTSTTDLDDEQQWLVSIIRTCGQSTLEQVNNVLELTRLAASDGQEYPVTDVALGPTLRALVQQFQPEALRRGSSVDLIGPDEGSAPIVKLAQPLLRRVLVNLLSNAVKFTEHGRITLELSTEPTSDPNRVALRIAVRDTGIGIAEADLERIFRNFETLDSSYSRMQEGSGLGLGIAKLAAEAMGGHFEVASRPGEGSCFTLVMEAEVAAAPTRPAVPERIARGGAGERPLHILIAEDNQVNRILLVRQLERYGHVVTAVCDGQEALETGLAQPFDIVLMDVSMPRMDGLTASRLLRERGLPKAVPIFAVTAQAQPDRVHQFKAAGMTEVVTKPVNIDALNRLMQQRVGPVSPMQELRMPAPPPRASEPAPESAAAPAAPSASAPALLATAEPITKSDKPLLDDRILAELEEDMGRDFIGMMADRFSADMSSALGEAQAALEGADHGELARVAHRSAGAAAVLGLAALADELRALERAAPTEGNGMLSARCARIRDLSGQSEARLRAALVD